MADPDFPKGSSGPSSVYDNSASGLGLNPAYLANVRSESQSAASSGGSGGTSGLSSARPPAASAVNQFYYGTDNGLLYFSNGSTWYTVPDAAMFAGEAAGGALAGTYPNPTLGNILDLGVGSDLAINASGAITVTHTIHRVTSTGGFTLKTISVGVDGQLLFLINQSGGVLNFDASGNVSIAGSIGNSAARSFVYHLGAAKWYLGA